MKSKKGMILSGTLIAVILLFAVLWLPRFRAGQEQAGLYLQPLIKEANLLSSQLRDVTGKKENDISRELDALREQFDSFMTAALDTRNITEEEPEGFADFESVLGHCEARIRVMTEANQKGEPFVPEEISFLNALDRGVCALAEDLQDENGVDARFYSEAVTSFAQAIRET